MAKKPKSKKIYRERAPVATFFRTIGIIVAVVVVLALIIFFYFRRYIVYTSDGVRLDIPSLAWLYGEDEKPSPSEIQIVIEESTIETDENREDEPEAEAEVAENVLKAVSISGALDSENIESVMAKINGESANALAMTLKNSSGELMFQSHSQTVSDYEISNGADISIAVSELKAQGVYLVAYVSAFRDNTLSIRGVSSALLTENGELYKDSSDIGWLNPQSETTISYLSEICSEIAALGFNEIVLTDFKIPTATNDSDTVSTLSEVARTLKATIGDTTKLSVYLSSDAWSNESGIQIYSEIFYRLFAGQSDSAISVPVAEAVFGAEFNERFILEISSEKPENNGWVKFD